MILSFHGILRTNGYVEANTGFSKNPAAAQWRNSRFVLPCDKSVVLSVIKKTISDIKKFCCTNLLVDIPGATYMSISIYKFPNRGSINKNTN